MMRRTSARWCLAFQPSVVTAAIALILGVALPARAQYYDYSGSVSTYPSNLFPIDVGTALLDLAANTLDVGSGAVGSFSALTGAQLSAGGLAIADGGTGAGTVSVAGAGTLVTLGGGGAMNRLQVGNWGTGTLTVSAGAVIDATANASGCASGWCNNFIGNAAGSNGTLTVTGAGSKVSALNSFVVGQVAVFTLAKDGFDFGTPGGTTNAFVNVLAGGTMNTQHVVIGQGPNSASATGAEKAYGTVVIDGAGSSWTATQVGSSSAYFVAGSGGGGHATVDVQNGGSLIVNGTGGSTSNYDGIYIGARGGQGDVTVTGVGSNIQVLGNNPYIAVGGLGGTPGGQGSLSILAGATTSAMFMDVGRNAASGTLLIDGSAGKVSSQLNLVGVGTPGLAGAAGVLIGLTGGTGQATVSNGGQLYISDGGADSRTPDAYPGNSPYLEIGQEAGSTGSLTVTGIGSSVQIVSTSMAPPTGVADNYNPYLALGRFTGSAGTLTISNGGTLSMQGGALSTVANSRGTTAIIGGDGDKIAGGSGTALVTGAGSALTVTGSDAFIAVGWGPGATGQLTISNQGTVSSTVMNVGRSGGVGTLTMDDGILSMSGQQTGSFLAGAVLSIGNGGGTGTATVTSGSQINLTNLGTSGANVNLGGTGAFPLGNGTLTVSGASTINITAAPGLASFTVGRDGTGVASFTGGSSINIGDGSVYVGRLPGSSGTLTLASGSTLSAGVVNIGGYSLSTAGGNGSATVTGLGSAMTASGAKGIIGVGSDGTGSLAVSSQATVLGIDMTVGSGAGGVGILSVDNSTLDFSGQQPAGGNGAALAVGYVGGTGTASITNGSVVNITNLGSAGASLNVGGTHDSPLGTGTFTVSNSQVNVIAAPGLATTLVGSGGNGTATFTNSKLNIGSNPTAGSADGSLYVAAQPGSTGVLWLNTGSVVNTGFVGIGISQPALVSGTSVTQYRGGNGHLILDGSTINTTTLEVGSNSVLSGNGGTINATGNVIVGGTISPGDSPGKLRINCDLITLPGSTLILDVQALSGGGYNIDNLILGSDAKFNLANLHIVFNFMGTTDPNAFEASGKFNLDSFLRTAALGSDVTAGLSTVFAPGQDWTNVVNAGAITAESAFYNVTELNLQGDTAGSFTVTAVPVPEPSTWAMLVAGLFVLCVIARQRQGIARRS